jgi:hypothetical protein
MPATITKQDTNIATTDTKPGAIIIDAGEASKLKAQELAKKSIENALESCRKGKFTFSANAFTDVDTVLYASEAVMNAIAEGKKYKDVVMMPENQYLDIMSEQLGWADSKSTIRQNAHNEALRAKYLPTLIDNIELFDALFNEQVETNKRLHSEGKPSTAYTFVMTVSGDVVTEDFTLDAQAAQEFMSLKRASTTSQISVSGIRFGVVYKNGASKIINVAR